VTDEAQWPAGLRPSRIREVQADATSGSRVEVVDGRAVLDCGAVARVAPDGAPFGYASFSAPVFSFHELTEQRSLAEAVQRLRQHDRELGTWQLHT
jgi:hypothetical protein